MNNKKEYLVDDAREMMHILQTSRCMARYDHISHELLAELLVAIASDGEVIGGNRLGSDVKSPAYGYIEVKSRILGTDGPLPRISLKQRNLDKSDWIAAVRWERDFTLYDAIMLPKEDAERLYKIKKQGAKDQAHIAWRDWVAEPRAESIKAICLRAMNRLSVSI